MSLPITVLHADVASVEADVLLLKYARSFHGADEAIALRLTEGGVCREQDISPDEGDYCLIPTGGAVRAQRVLLLGTGGLREFRYRQMRQFARLAVEILAAQQPSIESLALTVHGVNYGLDIEEALRCLVLGLQQGLVSHPLHSLRKVTFVERNARRFDILNRALADIELVLPAGRGEREVGDLLPTRAEVERKKSVFVAMPFSEEFEDIYQFGIYAPVRQLGYVCEKVDESVFTGNIVERITEGIRSAEFVIADLSLERPNVYLEVGFAWGLKKPVILVSREGQRLHFDVSHHKCLFYRTIGKLSESLEKTIRDMFSPSSPVEQLHG